MSGVQYCPMREGPPQPEEDEEGDFSGDFLPSEQQHLWNSDRWSESMLGPRKPTKRRMTNLELDPQLNARVAASKAISILMKMEHEGYCGVEQDSVYGAAVVMPQIARSAGWPKTLVVLTIRVYIFLVVNFLLQGFLVCVINEEAIVMNAYSGQMHLCDFGASIESCPGAPSCLGPSGTEITAPRLYSYAIWSTRIFIRDSMKTIFPDKADEIEGKIDPGEYGIENYYCRLVCCFLFMMAVVDDLRATIELGYLLLLTPSQADFWIHYETPEWAEKDEAKAVHSWGELDLVKFQIGGMPRKWKMVNLLFVLLPKLILWYGVTSAGFRFLMETAGIVDLVVNAMALTFVLSIDEMIMERFGTVATKHMMSRLEAFPLFDTKEEEHETAEQAYRRVTMDEELGKNGILSDCKLLILLVPKRLIFVALLMVIFIYKYYYTNCKRMEDGTWVSMDMYLPRKVKWDPLSLLFGHDTETTPFWTMPDLTPFTHES